MRAYLIKAPGASRYGGTRAQATTTRADLADQLGVMKKQVTITEVEIPTNKPDLLTFINGLCKDGDTCDESTS